MPMKPKIFVILGADRVGKSTFIENSYEFLIGSTTAAKLHFSGPQPHHNNPIDQYIEPLNAIGLDKVRYILCDRGFSEVCFYEKFRRNIIISARNLVEEGEKGTDCWTAMKKIYEEAEEVLKALSVTWVTTNTIRNRLRVTGMAFFDSSHRCIAYYDEVRNVLSII